MGLYEHVHYKIPSAWKYKYTENALDSALSCLWVIGPHRGRMRALINELQCSKRTVRHTLYAFAKRLSYWAASVFSGQYFTQHCFHSVTYVQEIPVGIAIWFPHTRGLHFWGLLEWVIIGLFRMQWKCLKLPWVTRHLSSYEKSELLVVFRKDRVMPASSCLYPCSTSFDKIFLGQGTEVNILLLKSLSVSQVSSSLPTASISLEVDELQQFYHLLIKNMFFSPFHLICYIKFPYLTFFWPSLISPACSLLCLLLLASEPHHENSADNTSSF